MKKETELETRLKIIDKWLVQAGWTADTSVIRYAKGARPKKGKNQAIAEYPLETGIADYALFCGETLIGIVEAKKKDKDIVSDLSQAEAYAKVQNIPFIFATNGREYFKQFIDKSGIWFRDRRNPKNHAKVLQSFYTPDGLLKLLELDIESANQNLKKESLDFLTDLSGLGLRYYQIEAIQSIELALEDPNRDRILVEMATGTGKTRTIVGLVYRLLEKKRFHRILFLVDRNNLGEQTQDVFKESKVKDLLTFTQIFTLTELEETKPELSTKIQIATVQGMVHRLFYNQEEKLTVDTFDCIIVDEAHRGYILDKEVSEEELLFKDLDDYISKYRKVLEYFDSVKISLTATPALHTVEIFGKPVYTYSYKKAVFDGYLVDHAPPHIIETQLLKDGIHWNIGSVVKAYSKKTQSTIDLYLEKDELNFEIESFNKKVETESFNRTVVQELIKNIDPTSKKKTIIFAASNEHADLLVRILFEEFQKSGFDLDDEAIKKITSKANDPKSLIKRFKNEALPNIAITVDLLTTGVDIPSVCYLVFLRLVKSRILYEQILGRATRLCPEIDKRFFEIFDAVGLYDKMKDHTNMKPIVKNPHFSIVQLIDELSLISDEATKKDQLDWILSKSQRKSEKMDEADSSEFMSKSKNQTIQEIVSLVHNADGLDNAVQILFEYRQAFEVLDRLYNPDLILKSEHQDNIHSVYRGYGKKNSKPEDYLESFGQYIRENINLIPALQIIAQRPKDLTREDLKKLMQALHENDFREENLNTAYNEMTNAQITADIISFIRRYAIGSPLVSHEDRMKNSVQKLKQVKKWTYNQLQWIERIEKQLLKDEVLVNREMFQTGIFKEKGGFDIINKQMNNELAFVIDQLNEYLYA